MPILEFLTKKKEGRKEPYIPIKDEDNLKLHHGQCPKCKAYLRKKGRMAVCKSCGYRKPRADILAISKRMKARYNV